jgi:glucose/arabinose dehydrogenase
LEIIITLEYHQSAIAIIHKKRRTTAMLLKKIALYTAVLLGLSAYCHATTILTGKSDQMEYQVDEVTSGLGVIWGLAFLSPTDLLITERSGTIKKLNLKTKKIVTIKGGPEVWANGQGGLLDVAVPQDYSTSGWIYFTYSKEVNGQGVTALARARLEGDQLTNLWDLLVTDSASDTSRHFGSRIVFDQQGHLFFSIGDRGVRPNSQNRFNHAGTILRLNLDGSVPADNPFVKGEGLPEIWSYGHRNPQGLFWHSESGKLWSNEHGPRGGDEINLIEPGNNYGWPVVSHGKEYWGPVAVGEATSKPNMTDPLKVFTPSIAPGSLLIYSGKAFPSWRDNFFSGALALVHLNRVVFDANNVPVHEDQLLNELDERIRAVVESPEGWIYLSTDSGRILRIKPRL